MAISETKIKAYALKNAIAYKGKANPGAVISALFNEGLEKSGVKEIMPKIQETIKEISKLSLEEQKKEFEKLEDEISEREEREGLPELPHSEKGVIMRFAPSASGPIHVAHALVASMSINYVNKYNGKLYWRIEDTNPERVYPESYNLLEEDGNWLSKNNAITIIQSDRMDLYYKRVKELLKKDKSYVCNCSGEDFREFSKQKKNCPCRNNKVEENLEKWEKMLKGDFNEGEVVVRFKSDMKHKNPAMRDFPLARVNKKEHPRQGKKYSVWPLMSLAVAIDDLEMGMTHIIRGKDHRDNAKRQKMIFEALGFSEKVPWTGYLGRYHFKGMELSTSKFRQGIKEGKYSGWDDPKLPTIQSLKKQGYKPEAFWKIAEHIGLSEVDKTLEKEEFFRLLKEFNKNV